METNKEKISVFIQNSYSKLVIIFKNLRKHLYSCDLCQQPSNKYSLLCNTCYQDIGRFNLNSVQGNLLNHPKINQGLPSIHFQQLIALAPYCWPYSSWISELKYQQRFELAPLLATMLVEQLKQLEPLKQDPDVLPNFLIPVPIHPYRLKNRQFNQAALIAKRMAVELGCKYNETLIVRNVKTDPQVGQGGVARRRNLKGAFAMTVTVNLPEHVGIVDDVVTTGATVSEMAKLLTQHGVKKITVLSICLSIPK